MIDSGNGRNSFKKSSAILLSIALGLCFLLVVKLFILQVVDAQKYTTLSDKNRIRVYPVVQRRGRIFSSDGKVLAHNRQRYRLSLESCDKEAFQKNLDIISPHLSLSEDEKKHLLEIRRLTPRYSPIIIKNELSWDEYSKIAMIFYRLNNVSLENSFTREYPEPFEFAHVLGYTARSKDYLRFLSGQTGVEAYMDDYLVGIPGNVKMETNSVGKKIRVLDSVAPVDGDDITLTLDYDIQKYSYEAISAEKAGACVVLNIQTGGIVALVSVPGFDPNPISSKLSQKQWNELLNDPLKPLINRAVSGVYPPGSVFKIVTVLAALEKGIVAPHDTFFCSGGTVVDGHVFHCWKRYGHGKVDVYDALRYSCDCYIFEVARKLGINNIVEYAQKLGFGQKVGIEIPNENAGLLPNKQWKLTRYGSGWKPYETVITAIGQGALLATLIQSATMMGKIFSGDYDFAPTLLKNNTCTVPKAVKNPINPKNLKIIKDALYQVCNAGGTASRSCRADYGIAGKTGSSQVRRIKKGEEGINQQTLPWRFRDHAFFVGCAPFKKPKYVVAVMVEHGGSGSQKAAPIARKIFDRLMQREQ